MAIISLDTLIAGMQPSELYFKVGIAMEATGILYSPFYVSGRPGAAAVPTSLNGAALTSYSGQIPFHNPVSGNSYLVRFSSTANNPGTLILCDRLWHNGTIVSTGTGEQAITHPGLPARCLPATGATPDASGAHVMCGIEYSTAGNAAAITNTTLNYTNSAGTASRTGTIATTPGTPTAGTFIPFVLQAGDLGIRTIQGLTLGTSYGTAVIHLVQYRVIAVVDNRIANYAQSVFAPNNGLPRVYDNTVPFCLWIASSTTLTTMTAQITMAHG